MIRNKNVGRKAKGECGIIAAIQALEPRRLFSVTATELAGPLTTGTQWQYLITKTGGGFDQTVVETVIGDATFNNSSATEIDSVFSGTELGVTETSTVQDYRALTSDGLVSYGDVTTNGPILGISVPPITLTSTPPDIDLPASLTPMVTVKSNYSDTNTSLLLAPSTTTGTISFTLESDQRTSVTVPAGTFSCYIIDEVLTAAQTDGTTQTTYRTEYYSPGVGQVQEIAGQELQGQTTQLSSFNGTIPEAGVPDHLSITQQPAIIGTNAILSPAVTVEVDDAFGDVVSSDNSQINLAIGPGSDSGSLHGSMGIVAENGIATFSDLSIDKAGNYRLIATDGGLASPNSPFIVVRDNALPQPTLGGALTASIVRSTLPSSILQGQKLHGKVSISFSDTSNQLYQGASTVDLYAVDSTGSPTLLGSVKEALVVKLAKATSVTVPVSSSLLPAGTYTLVLVTIDTASHLVTTATGQSINVAASFVDLSNTITNVAPASGQILPGKPFTVSLDVTNHGNVLATGSLTTTFSITTSSAGLSPVFFGNLPEHIHILPGGHQTFRVTRKSPVGSIPGTYYWVTTLDPGNTFNESDSTNNIAVSPTPITVLPPYPVLGTFTGTVSTTRGPDKGVSATQLWTVTSEDQTTGTITFTGINTFANGSTASGSGTGTITTKGIITGSYPGFGTFKGKFTGNKFVGTHTELNGDFGLFSLTLD